MWQHRAKYLMQLRRFLAVRGELVIIMLAVMFALVFLASIWPTRPARVLTALEDLPPPARTAVPDVLRLSDLARFDAQLSRLDQLSQRLVRLEKTSSTYEKHLADIVRIDQRLDDLERINRRLSRLEKLAIEREEMQRQAMQNIQESKIRMRTMEDQLGMLRIAADDTKVNVEEIRDLLKENVIKALQQQMLRDDTRHERQWSPPNLVPRVAPDPKTMK